MNQKEEFENNKVLLWGLHQADIKMLKKYDVGNKNPRSTAQVKKEKQPSKKVVKKEVKREFSLDENYGINDLPFLNAEYDRIEEALSSGKLDRDLEEEYYELQDKLYELIENLNSMKELQKNLSGSGIYDDIDDEADDEPDIENIEIPIEKGGKVKLKGRSIKKTDTSKSRVEKGSEKAKDIGKRLAEARKVKREANTEFQKKKEEEKRLAEEKAKAKEAKKKPWFYIGDIPEGYREATMEEAVLKRKVSYYGKHVVDPVMYNLFENYNILLSHNLTKFQVVMYLNLAKKKALRALEDIEIYKNKIENPKYDNTVYENKLEMAKETLNMMTKAYKWLVKTYLPDKYNKGFKFRLPEKPEIIPSKSEPIKIPPPKVIIDPRTNKPAVFSNPAVKSEEEKYYFYRGDEELSIKKSFFTKDNVLKPVYAKKLFDRKMILPMEYYSKEDINKYFFTKDKTGRGIFDTLYKKFTPIDIFYNKHKFTLKSQAVLDIVGNSKIVDYKIKRNPVSHALIEAFNVMTLGDFKKRFGDKPYDELYHLCLICKTDDNKVFSIEKNENVKVSFNPVIEKDAEIRHMNVDKSYTINELINNCINKIGKDKFFVYDGVNNNCQDFIINLLQSSNIGSSEDYKFIKQDTADLFTNQNTTRKTMRTITDTYGRVRGFLGGNIKIT